MTTTMIPIAASRLLTMQVAMTRVSTARPAQNERGPLPVTLENAFASGAQR